MSLCTTSALSRSLQQRRGHHHTDHGTFRKKLVFRSEVRNYSLARGDDQGLGPEGLSSGDQATWIACRKKLIEIGMTEEDAEKAMVRGFGWGSQAYWRQELVRASPSLEAIDSVLEYLGSQRIGLEKNSEKAEVIQKFPEVLQVSQSLMEENVSKLEKNFFLKGKSLTMSLKRKPRVLGATTDCAGDCAGDCTRCFAQF